jgi:hypothetical protein
LRGERKDEKERREEKRETGRKKEGYNFYYADKLPSFPLSV